MSDVTGLLFATFMRERVLVPAGMSRSTYEQPFPAALADIAGTYRFPGDAGDAVSTLQEGRLFLRHPSMGRVELRAESGLTLFNPDDGTRYTIVREDGRVVAITAFGRRRRSSHSSLTVAQGRADIGPVY